MLELLCLVASFEEQKKKKLTWQITVSISQKYAILITQFCIE